MRAAGLDYMEIARRGGGIHSSVRDLRTRSEDELFDARARRGCSRLASFGTTTVEVKSGYGLTLDDELKSLRVIARLADALPLRIVPTFLGAHEIPLEHREQRGVAASIRRSRRSRDDSRGRRGKARAVRRRLLRDRRLHRRRKPRAFSTAARDAGLLIKLHADELTSSGGAELAASLGATSADHLAAVSDDGHRRARAERRPSRRCFRARCSFSASRSRRRRAGLIDAGVPVALATDFNPGTSPTPNLPLVLTLGVSQLRFERRRGGDRGDGERGGGARRSPTESGRSRRAFPPIWRCSTSGMSASCRIGTATTAAWPRGHAANLVTRVT